MGMEGWLATSLSFVNQGIRPGSAPLISAMDGAMVLYFHEQCKAIRFGAYISLEIPKRQAATRITASASPHRDPTMHQWLLCPVNVADDEESAARVVKP